MPNKNRINWFNLTEQDVKFIGAVAEFMFTYAEYSSEEDYHNKKLNELAQERIDYILEDSGYELSNDEIHHISILTDLQAQYHFDRETELKRA